MHGLAALPAPLLLRIHDQQTDVPPGLGEFSKVTKSRIEIAGAGTENLVGVIDAGNGKWPLAQEGHAVDDDEDFIPFQVGDDAIVLIAAGADNLAVVAPASSALDAARALRDDGAVAPGRLGVEAIDVDPGISGAMEIPGGAHITTVEPGSAAAGAGLQVNDVIVAIDDQPIAGASDLVISLRSSEPASTVELSWRRGTDEQTAQVVLD